MYGVLAKIRNESRNLKNLQECIDVKLKCLEFLESLGDEMLYLYNDDEKAYYMTMLNDLIHTFGQVSFVQGWMMCEKDIKNKA